jgi:hypothetical protein
MTITEFLLARITEDEAVLTRRGPYAHSWHGTDVAGTFNPGCPECLGFGARARVLAECAAKRAIVGLHRRVADLYGETLGDTCTMCHETGPEAQAYPCATVRALAAVYADHPDYQPAWVLAN